MPLSNVIIIGAGPSGLLLALLLTRASIPVTILEQSPLSSPLPRASHYTADSCAEFRRAGVLPAILAQGFLPDGVSWRRLDDNGRERLVQVRNGIDEDGLGMVCLPLQKLGAVLEGELRKMGGEVRYGRRVVEGGEGEAGVWVRAEVEGGGEEVWEGSYVVGCDGANSVVRKWLFGESFPGFTWGEQIVATNVYYSGFGEWDYDDSQFFVHPEHWHMVAKIQPDGLYRVTYGEKAGLTPDELKARQPDKFQAFLPGHPTPDKYTLVNFSPYRVHQRCVDKMRVGRFILAADAAHLCNPFGGLGLTGGIADVGSLYDSLVGIHTGQADESILDVYDEVRRRIWRDIIDPVSSENMMRLFKYSGPDEAMEKDAFFKMMRERKEAEEGDDPPGLPSLRYDMTQHYTKKEA